MSVMTIMVTVHLATVLYLYYSYCSIVLAAAQYCSALLESNSALTILKYCHKYILYYSVYTVPYCSAAQSIRLCSAIQLLFCSAYCY